jgi:hypothetical protein
VNINPTLSPLVTPAPTTTRPSTNNRNLAELSVDEAREAKPVSNTDNQVNRTLGQENSFNANQFERISRLPTNDDSEPLQTGPNSGAISEYVQTESIEKRQALESLVGLDLFV